MESEQGFGPPFSRAAQWVMFACGLLGLWKGTIGLPHYLGVLSACYPPSVSSDGSSLAPLALLGIAVYAVVRMYAELVLLLWKMISARSLPVSNAFPPVRVATYLEAFIVFIVIPAVLVTATWRCASCFDLRISGSCTPDVVIGACGVSLSFHVWRALRRHGTLRHPVLV